MILKYVNMSLNILKNRSENGEREENGEWKCKEFFVCEREEKSWNFELNETNYSFETLYKM